jgi:hypothetical protein
MPRVKLVFGAWLGPSIDKNDTFLVERHAANRKPVRVEKIELTREAWVSPAIFGNDCVQLENSLHFDSRLSMMS